MCVRAQLDPTFCHSMDCSPPGSAVLGISQAGILEWVAIPSSRGSSQPRDQIGSLSLGQILYHLSHHGSLKAMEFEDGSLLLSHVEVKVGHLCALALHQGPTLRLACCSSPTSGTKMALPAEPPESHAIRKGG